MADDAAFYLTDDTEQLLTQYAKLTAHKAGTATVTAKAKNGTATYDLAVTVNEASGAGTFNIVGDTLVSYSGSESTVTIPTASASSGRTPSRTTTTFSTSFAPTAWSRSTTVRSMTATTCRASACLRR